MARQVILVLAANPQETAPIDIGREVRNIQRSIRGAPAGHRYRVEPVLAPRYEDVRQALLDSNPSIVHFCGHGNERGLMFDGDDGVAQIRGDVLGELFQLFAAHVRCVVLSACCTNTQAEAIARHIDFVVGIDGAFDDLAAAEFAAAFYDAIGADRPFDFAFECGLNALRAGVSVGVAEPVLFRRSTASPRSATPAGERAGRGSSRRLRRPSWRWPSWRWPAWRWLLAAALGIAALAAWRFAGFDLPSAEADTADMVLVQPSGASRARSEVTTAFWIDRHEITVGEYLEFCSHSRLSLPPDPDFPDLPRYYDDPRWRDHPAVNVTWFEAEAYCRSLGKRLPDRREWWLAAMPESAAETATPDFLDPRGGLSGNHPDRSLSAFYPQYELPRGAADDGYPWTAPIGKFPANARGIFDLDGNVSEWCADPPSRDRVPVCGPSWAQWPRPLTGDYSVAAAKRSRFLGFRCAADTTHS